MKTQLFFYKKKEAQLKKCFKPRTYLIRPLKSQLLYQLAADPCHAWYISLF